ncbi:beta-ketoacyl synthase N-terminal-like domain-containing protein [Kutzneria buriramensis]|uniref:3-oxoacyl-[acyl-carrier-protein] synthase II n=1 Tax=Kutzneria buriramensis TaxID=1045776 RepID=A0A3E0HR68_9PSEU|nr:beta-ketoacyl synthase N-terminal-like domain-containing protein [Kutzneria buriramensis]REH48485.1 3-oxoacyl-[acyl-carrier-protein] synthase II [Kutzneria buriramensis]
MTAATAPDAGALVVTAWSAVSAFGMGSAAFRDGVSRQRDAVTAVDLDEFPGPFERAGLIPGFSPTGHLGAKGTRNMDRLTAIAVSTVGQLVREYGGEVTEDPERVGLVLGTGSGSVQSIMDFTRDSLVGEKPYHVDPAKFPNTVMNKATAQSAIWHGIKGPNTTIAGDWLTGLLALSYAVRLCRAGHCDRVLVGAVEEYSTQRAWLEWHAGAAGDRAPALGEGGAIFLVEPVDVAARAGRTPLASVLATRFMAAATTAQAGETLADCVRAALRQAGVAPARVRVVAPAAADGGLGSLESAAITEVLGETDARWVRCRPLLGDASAVSTAFQLAAALGEPLGRDEVALVTGIDRDGAVGCAVLGGGTTS